MFTRHGDQELFEETTERFLEASCPPAKLRELYRTGEECEASYWRQGAELGWTSLLVPEELGGGSVSDQPVRDLALVAYRFGFHAAPGPLVGTNLVAAALARWGSDDQKRGPLVRLTSGETAAAWAPAVGAAHGLLAELPASETGDGLVLSGQVGPVEGGSESGYYLLAMSTPSGLRQALIERSTPGLTVTPLHGLDLTRRFVRLDLDGVVLPTKALVGPAGAGEAAIDWLFDLALTLQLAEMCGAMQWAFDHTLEWATNRYSFGRPLASYQAIKHRMADMKLWLEASLAIAGEAARAMSTDAENRSDLASAGKFYLGRYGVELMQECVQLHGGIGVTFDHDLHLFLRRVTTDASVFGSPSQHADRLCSSVEKGAVRAAS